MSTPHHEIVTQCPVGFRSPLQFLQFSPHGVSGLGPRGHLVAASPAPPPRRYPRVPRGAVPGCPAPLSQGAPRPGAQARRVGMAAAAALLGRAAGLGLVTAAGGRRLLRCGAGAGLRERGTGTLLDATAVCRAGGAAEQCLSRGISSDQRPKRPLTAYLRFVMDNRPAFREKNPGMRFEGRWARGLRCGTFVPQSGTMACAPQSGVSQEAGTTQAFVKLNLEIHPKT